MFVVDVLSRILHVGTAITLVGGSVFMLLVLLPAAQALSEDAHQALRAAIQNKWKRFVHLGIALFLVTGFYNFFVALPAHRGDGLYHALIGIKILLALAVFFIASALVGKSAKFEAMRQARAKWLTILVLLAAIIVAISGFAKVRGGSQGEVAPAEALLLPATGMTPTVIAG